jgi:hypothetical protein
MGVGIEYCNKPSLNTFFIGPGSCRSEDIIERKLGIVVISSLERNRGTVFLIGKTSKIELQLYENELDGVGNLVKAERIEKNGREITIVDIKSEQELLVTFKKGRFEKKVCVFMCKCPEAIAEKLME